MATLPQTGVCPTINDSAQYWAGQGDALAALKPEEAVLSYRRALAIEPRAVPVLFSLGFLLLELERPGEALECYDAILATHPDNVKALANRGVALLGLGRREEARASYLRVTDLCPEDPEAHFNLGFVQQELESHEEALTSYSRAIALRPDYPAALSNLGLSLQHAGRHAEALATYERALRLEPDSVQALANRGSVLQELGRHEEALADYARIQSLRPDDPDAHWNEALCRLRLGDFVRGWNKYEWRWKTGSPEHQRRFAQPLWTGRESLAGRTILLHAEQGIGDTLQFCRYAERVSALGAKVVLEVQPPLTTLLSGLRGVDGLIGRGAPLPAFDFHCPLLSLPCAFSTRIDAIPWDGPYVRSDPALVAHWRKSLGERRRLRVGLAWSGRAEQASDRTRSIRLSDLAPVLSCNADFFALQKDIRAPDLAYLDARKDIRCLQEDFSNTAALIQLMDVVVTVDTSIAHLAGALGRPFWLLLSASPDWRWMLHRSDSPWYPSARLFRQPSPGAWPHVVGEVAKALRQLDSLQPGERG